MTIPFVNRRALRFPNRPVRIALGGQLLPPRRNEQREKETRTFVVGWENSWSSDFPCLVSDVREPGRGKTIVAGLLIIEVQAVTLTVICPFTPLAVAWMTAVVELPGAVYTPLLLRVPLPLSRAQANGGCVVRTLPN